MQYAIYEICMLVPSTNSLILSSGATHEAKKIKNKSGVWNCLLITTVISVFANARLGLLK